MFKKEIKHVSKFDLYYFFKVHVLSSCEMSCNIRFENSPFFWWLRNSGNKIYRATFEMYLNIFIYK